MLLLFVLGCSSPDPAPASPKSPERPDILLVTLDTTRVDALACYGNRQASTPTLDRLAEEGIRFSRAFSVTPLTIPAHSSLMTGLYPPRHGVRDNGDFFLGPEAVTLAERLKEAGYATMASVGAEVTSHHWGFSQGFDAYFDDMGEAGEGAANRWRVERPGAAVVEDALGWLSARDRAVPWMAWVHFFDAHHPYAPPEPYAARFPEQPYLGELAYVDDQLARLLAAVDLERTLVVVVADHGEGMGSHGELLHGVLLYNATVRIPFIVRPPGGLAAPRYLHFPASLVDVMPTLLAMSGGPPVEGVDGMDLSPWLRATAEEVPAPPEDRAVYIESLYAWRHYGWASQRALVTAERKLIDSTTPELYARTDYAELENLAPAGAGAGEVAALQGRVAGLAAALADAAGASGVAQAGALDAEQRAQLEALGYMTALAEPAAGEAGGGTDGFGAGLADPVARLPVLREVESARQAFQAGDLDGALARIAEVLAQEPGLASPRQLRAHILWRQGRLDEALAELEALQAERPSAQVELTMGLVRLERGDLEGGLALLEAALVREPYLDAIWQPYLRTLFLAGRAEELDAALAEAARRRPALGTAAVLGAARAVQQGEAGAAARLEAALGRWPEEPLGRTVLAEHYLAAGESIAAEQLLREEIALAPGALLARQHLVALLAEQRRHAEQLAELEALAALAPPDPVLVHAQAQALFNLGRFEDSLAACERCLALDPASARCRLLSANALQKLGREDEARAAWQQARDLAGLPPLPP